MIDGCFSIHRTVQFLWGFYTDSIGWPHTWRDLADSGRVPTITLITVGALDEDSAVAETLCKHLPADVVQSHTATLKETQTQ